MINQEQIVKEIYAALHIAELTWTMKRNKAGQVIIDYNQNGAKHIVIETNNTINVNAQDTPLVKLLYDIRNN